MKLAPSADNLYLGAGNVFFDRFDANGASTGMRHLGNVDTFEVTSTPETKEKKNSMDGAKATYAEVLTGVSAEVSMVLTEYTKENLALAMLGQDAAFTQSAVATVTDQAIGPIAASVLLDVWYDIGAINPVFTTVKQGATTLNAAAYELNAEAGMMRLLSSYAGANKAVPATAITWSGSIPAIVAGDGKYKVEGLTNGLIKGRVRYISAANQAQGARQMVDVWLCGLTPDGALGFITEDFGTFNLKGKVYADTTRPVGQRYYRTLFL